MKFSIRMLLALLAYAGLLCGSILTVNPWWAEILLLVTFFMLAIAASLALFGRTERRPAYGAFAVTAGAYLLLTVSPGGFDGFPTHQLAQDWNARLDDHRSGLLGAQPQTIQWAINTTSPSYAPQTIPLAPYPTYVPPVAVPAPSDDPGTEESTPTLRLGDPAPPAPNTPPPTVAPPQQVPVTWPVYPVATPYSTEQTRLLFTAQKNFPRVCHAVFGTLLGLLAAVIVASVVRRSTSSLPANLVSNGATIPPSGAS